MSEFLVKLFTDWRGFRTNEVISVHKDVAFALEKQNIGEIVNKREPQEKEFKKNVKGAVKDKQVKAAPISKVLEISN
jgi:hypothetical protein